ncbi:putative recessive suppressor of secretory defect [Triangularia verruculosa]|uniref:Recessive suppressor of secretory defect n=1 Tax=Triangularia verruculosa TaxID=2587418 RepID=A0AAN6XM15_9PEZI|nr:putative recessive suppressor of secretory defect [Triangularia verruculosa]
MPGLARKVLIAAAVDGLILHPLNPVPSKDAPAGSRPPPLPLVKIKYGNNVSVSTVSRDHAQANEPGSSSFEAYGIVGIITVFHYSYLITITRRQQVANLFSKHPIYVVTEVALTPLTSQQEAADSIAKTSLALKNRQQTDGTTSPSTSGDDETSPEAGGLGIDELPTTTSRDDNGAVESAAEDEWSTEATPATTARSSIAQDVISRRGSYGRFAQRWFSRSGWAAENKRLMGITADPPPPTTTTATKDGAGKASNKNVPTRFQIPEGADGSEAAISLLPKLLRTAQILFGASKTFFFSYDYDITRSFLNEKRPASGLTPLWRHVDGEYFWNGDVMRRFVEAGADGLVLPLMQGFVGEREFVVDRNPPQEDGEEGGKESVEMDDFSPGEEKGEEEGGLGTGKGERRFTAVLISRRSIKRAGLRYLRRGIDEGGWVANGVETEQLVYDAGKGDKGRVHSFVQVRGSFPVFFTQSPYSLKPAPVVMHSQEANYGALRKHFERLGERYGRLQVVNLVEKHGVEAPIAELYEKNVEKLNEELVAEGRPKIGFEWFDFHSVCRGMKFENVSVLLGILGAELDELGSSEVVDGVVKEKQKGVLRTNCMDCLDRTNVCQSSFGKYMLDAQLKKEGIDMEKQKDQENSWFNTLWADNGDAIGKQYAGTGAMKGDYTRTRKRNYRGALTDAGLSLTRLFNGMFNDFFLQASIDFLLGNVTSLVFEEFEANMMTKDPAVSMQNMRQSAIELCQKRVIEDEGEEFIGGWAFLTPSSPDTVRSAAFEEAVLLLTDTALYLCRFDWNLDKVSSFERVDLAHVTKIRFGTYITSTISPAQVDELRNVGLVIEYKPGSTDVTRVNTRSLSSMSDHPKPANDNVLSNVAGFFSGKAPAAVTPTRKIALKALYSQTSAAVGNGMVKVGGGEEEISRLTEIQQVVVIAAEIERLAMLNQPREVKGKKGDGEEEGHLIEKGDIISVAEARKNTTLLDQLGHSIKKLVWA